MRGLVALSEQPPGAGAAIVDGNETRANSAAAKAMTGQSGDPRHHRRAKSRRLYPMMFAPSELYRGMLRR